jgi:hypothetical protein
MGYSCRLSSTMNNQEAAAHGVRATGADSAASGAETDELQRTEGEND